MQAFEAVKSKEEFCVEGCHYELIPSERFEDAIDFYGNSLVADEPMCISLEVPFDAGYRRLIRNILEENLSIALLSSQTGEIIAGRFLNIASCNEDNPTGMYSVSDALKKLYDLLGHGVKLSKIFEHFGVEEVLECFGLGVHKEYRKLGIATKIMKLMIALVKHLDLGPIVIKGEGSSNFSKLIYEKLGFETLAEVVYADYRVDGEVIISKTGEHKSVKFYGKVVE